MKRTAIIFFLTMFLSLVVIGRNVFFAYRAPAGTKSVSVIGTFNDWSVSAGKMHLAFDNVWTAQFNIADGIYFYNFWVDGKVIPDPANPKRKPNGNGGYYSVLTVGVFTPPKGVLNDGVIHKNYVIFNQNSRIYVNPASTRTIYFAIDTLKNDVSEVYLKVGNESYKMDKYNLNPYTDRYQTIFHPKTSRFLYSFILKDGNTSLYEGKNGLSSTPSSFIFDFSNPSVKILNAPQWSKGAVIYEIFPERFFDGNPSNDPPYVSPWGGTPTYDNFFGGDLQGIIDKVGYLKDLGVNVVYTTPIFDSPSNHKYNTTDYMRIDPHFGTMQTFENLLKTLHSHNIKWILDGVFNHTGTSFFAFQDLLEKQKKSKYANWYFVKHFPIRIESGDYATFQNYPSLPKLNVDNPQVQRYLKKVVYYWTSKGIDGWRIDSANVISNEFLIKLYNWIHTVNPSSLDVAEIWSNVSNWFEEGAFNSVMNYLFKEAAYSYVVYGATAESFVKSTNSYLYSYPPQLWDSLWNLIDSHDTPRALTVLNGNVKKMKLLVGLQMTFIGAPMIYYGDEVGMTGGKDPLNRKCMLWDKRQWNFKIYNWYKKLISIREKLQAIKYGDYHPILEKGQVLVFRRTYNEESAYVFLNAADKDASFKLKLKGTFLDLISQRVWRSDEGVLEIHLQPYEMMILEKR